jgi:hypothetical protein
VELGANLTEEIQKGKPGAKIVSLRGSNDRHGRRNFSRLLLVGSFDWSGKPGNKGGKRDMSPKRTILKTLSDRQDGNGSVKLVRPSTIPGFQQAPEKYQQSINALLKDRLIEGIKDAEGHMAISLNTQRAGEIRKVLRPVWAHPAVLALLALFAAVAGMTLFA